jgi:hypothetical protein
MTSHHSPKARRPLPPGTWEFAMPEGTPCTPGALLPHDRERARLRAWSDHMNDAGDPAVPGAHLAIAVARFTQLAIDLQDEAA